MGTVRGLPFLVVGKSKEGNVLVGGVAFGATFVAANRATHGALS